MFSIILFLESLGGGELMVILLFILIFFGSKNIPSLARGLGKGIREFKDAMNGVQSELRQGMNEVERQIEKAATPEPVKMNTPAPANTSQEGTNESTGTEDKSTITTASFIPPPAAQPRE